MSDISDRLRHTAGHLINGNVEDGSVEVAMLCEAADEIERLKAERLKLDRRIHNQRASLRQTWEIIEMRRNYMGSPASRAAFARLLKRHQKLLAEQRRRGPEFEKVLHENLWELYAR